MEQRQEQLRAWSNSLCYEVFVGGLLHEAEVETVFIIENVPHDMQTEKIREQTIGEIRGLRRLNAKVREELISLDNEIKAKDQNGTNNTGDTDPRDTDSY